MHSPHSTTLNNELQVYLLKEVIGKVFRDLKPTDSSWTMDAVEWIGEALDFIGYHGAFEEDRNCKCEGLRAAFPCLYALRAVEYGPGAVMGTSTAGYDTDRTTLLLLTALRLLLRLLCTKLILVRMRHSLVLLQVLPRTVHRAWSTT